MTEDQTVNNKDVATSKEFKDTPEVRAKIIAQIEYYFSDYNLSRDTFLRDKIKETTEGWVPIDTMIKFNRLRDLCNDGDKILEILSKSAESLDKKAPFMLTDSNIRCIKRNVDSYPLPADFEVYIKQLSNHSIYAKGFPKNSTFEEIKTFFVENYGPVLAVCMRYFNQGKKVATQQTNGCKRQFKGSVFVTFVESSDADKFLKAPSIKYKGQELVSRMPQHVYETQKKVEYEERQNKQKKGGRNNKDLPEGQNDATLASRVEELIQKGNILHLIGFKAETENDSVESKNQNITRHTLKEVFDNHGKVAWIDYEPGQSEAHIRFTGGTDVALQVLNKMAAKPDPKSTDLKDGQNGETDTTQNSWTLSLPGVEGDLEATILSGAEELKYWTDVVSHITKAGAGHKQGGKRKGNNKQFKSFGRKNGRNTNKRKHEDDSNNSGEKAATKIVKT